MAGQGAKRRGNLRKAREKQKLKKAAKEAAKAAGLVTIGIPSVTEDDLLAFQTTHFGDDGKPEVWVIDAETALQYDPALEDDGLGYYEDGVKRTLTDEQIEMFRHTEVELLKRRERLRKGAAEEEANGTDEAGQTPEPVEPTVSAASTELTTKIDQDETPTRQDVPKPATEVTKHQKEILPSESGRSHSSSSTGSRRKRRKQEIPYAERHKRKWEQYVEGEDPIEGAMTHRRLARELDELQEESVDLEY